MIIGTTKVSLQGPFLRFEPIEGRNSYVLADGITAITPDPEGGVRIFNRYLLGGGSHNVPSLSPDAVFSALMSHTPGVRAQ